MKKIVLFLVFNLLTLFVFSNFTDVKAETYEERIFELRGAWVSTVYNIDIGQQHNSTSSGIEAYKNQYLAILDKFEEYNMNAVFFQVRPVNDAFYPSEINPWSRYLIGLEGNDPGWDPLEWLVEVTHERGMEFHAWLNPYRASLDITWSGVTDANGYDTGMMSYLQSLPDHNFAKMHPELLVRGGNRILLNPGEPAVRQHIYDTIDEIVQNYDVDAIHFDDYFYTSVHDIQDNPTYAKPGYNPLGLNKANWRREQVNILVREIHEQLTEFNLTNDRDVQFGISPAALWAPSTSVCSARGMVGGTPNVGCYNYSSYHDLYADTKKWVNEEWLDYILPQNYFALSATHRPISEWWANEVEGSSVKLYIGLGTYRLTDSNWSGSEITNQLIYNNQFENIDGIVLFSYKDMVNRASDLQGLRSLWENDTLLPHLTEEAAPVTPPTLAGERKNQQIALSFQTSKDALGYFLYRFENEEPIQLTEANRVAIFSGRDTTISHLDNVENANSYTYILQTIQSNGEAHASTSIKSFSAHTNENAPTIEYFYIDNPFAAYPFATQLTLKGKAFDFDGDDLTYTIQLTLDGVRYRYSYTPVVEDGEFTFTYTTFYVPAEKANFKLIVSDGTDEAVAYSHNFVVAQNITNLFSVQNTILEIFQRQQNAINNILR